MPTYLEKIKIASDLRKAQDEDLSGRWESLLQSLKKRMEKMDERDKIPDWVILVTSNYKAGKSARKDPGKKGERWRIYGTKPRVSIFDGFPLKDLIVSYLTPLSFTPDKGYFKGIQFRLTMTTQIYHRGILFPRKYEIRTFRVHHINYLENT